MAPSVRLAVVSDTHGNVQLLSSALSLSRAGGRLDAVIHLGDEHTDLEGLTIEGEEALGVPGLQHPSYGGGTTPIALVRRMGGVTMAMAHQPSDLPSLRDFPGPRLFLHGHTHSLALSAEPSGVRFNPGHLSGRVDRGRPPSFGIVEIAEDGVAIRGVSVAGQCMLESHWPMELLARKGA
ncbi:MAG: metallophosphatase family protein [Candidatus Eisenbacteria bacterium]|jgi:predicted phosphodiesterase|nr:metallophosphatase family protein [Candidatus Eisenbacteria bacterium]